MSATITLNFSHEPGQPGVLYFRKDSNGQLLDFNDVTFKASGHTTLTATPTQNGSLPGLFSYSLSQSWGAGVYQALWYPSSARTTAPVITSFTLDADDLVVDRVSDLQESVTAVDANLSSGVNVSSVNSVAITGGGTTGNPWRPAA